MWTVSDSNRRPFACHANALPTELTAHLSSIEYIVFSIWYKDVNYHTKYKILDTKYY